LRQSRPEVKLPKLVLAGKRGWLDGETFNAARQSAGGSDILFTGYVAEMDLPALYSGATCFVYPSYFEGFGLPILEAMQCGAPVVAGNRTSIPELVGDAGLLFDPFDTNALVEALKRILDDADYRARLRAKGFLRSGEFSWKVTAQLTLKAYEKAFEASRLEHKVSH
jgi:glycosyltransferase involved in cell wall biosynthesis